MDRCRFCARLADVVVHGKSDRVGRNKALETFLVAVIGFRADEKTDKARSQRVYEIRVFYARSLDRTALRTPPAAVVARCT